MTIELISPTIKTQLYVKKNCNKNIGRIAAYKVFMLFMLGTAIFFEVAAQQKEFRYNVIYKGGNIGKMTINQIQKGDEMSIDVVSNISMRMLMAIKINIIEKSLFKLDKLMFSSVFREVNGKEKANRVTKYTNNNYLVTKEGKTGVLNKPSVNYNLIRLYSKEPENIAQVYSDNFQQFLNIQKTEPHTYKIDLPDGNHNVYHFKNGFCYKVAVHSTFFNIQMVLVE